MSKRSVICGGVRTPIGAFQGGLSSIRSPQLGALVIQALLARTGVEATKIDEVIMGCVCQAGLHQNPARQASIYGGVPDTVSAMTVNKVCGSGLKAVALADQAIRAGDKECVIAGGFENMSQIPYALMQARTGQRLGDGKITDLLVHDGLWDIYNDYHMGMTAEWVVDTYNVTREEQDAYAARSHARAVAAWENGKFDAEVVPVEVPQRRGDPVVVCRDEGPRADVSAEKMAHLRPAFKRDGGTVTAGNSSSINDGAAALLICSEDFAKANNLPIRAYIDGATTGARAPQEVMMAPVTSIRNLLEKTGTKVTDYGLFELNEAFAAQVLVILKMLASESFAQQRLGYAEAFGAVTAEEINVHGGSIALGHPFAATGARMVTTMSNELKLTGKSSALLGICGGGGVSAAAVLESI